MPEFPPRPAVYDISVSFEREHLPFNVYVSFPNHDLKNEEEAKQFCTTIAEKGFWFRDFKKIWEDAALPDGLVNVFIAPRAILAVSYRLIVDEEEEKRRNEDPRDSVVP